MVRDRGKAQAGQSTMEYLLILLGVTIVVYTTGYWLIQTGLASGRDPDGTGIFNKARKVLDQTGTRVVGDLNIPKQ
jgi:hypothetical protein